MCVPPELLEMGSSSQCLSHPASTEPSLQSHFPQATSQPAGAVTKAPIVFIRGDTCVYTHLFISVGNLWVWGRWDNTFPRRLWGGQCSSCCSLVGNSGSRFRFWAGLEGQGKLVNCSLPALQLHLLPDYKATFRDQSLSFPLPASSLS